MKLTKQNTRLILGSVLLTLLLVLVFQNSRSVLLTFFVAQVQLPLFLVILIAAAAGFGAGRLLRSRR